MKNELKTILTSLDEVDFRELQESLRIATYAKNIISDFELDKLSFCSQIGIEPKLYDSIIKGYYPYDLKIIYKLEVLRQKLESERAKDVAEKLIQFPDYKNSVPVRYLVQFAEMISKELKK